jgi:anthranilate phosphoribosyltransferase
VTTRQLSLNLLAEPREHRHDLMRQMVAERFTNQQIADVFTRLGMKTPSSKQYYAQLVGATLSKLRKRDMRKATNTIKLMEIALFLSEGISNEKQGSTP